jgi:hydrogenase maturation protein HypF
VIRRRFFFRGTVQGVGFRPAIYRLAASLGLSGFVQNRRSLVVAEVQGEDSDLALFASRLTRSLPAAARVESVETEEVEPRQSDTEFAIQTSTLDRFSFPPIPPDLALCPPCAQELLDPSNRRFLYPFITCTQCGPRYSIVEATPFDRENTSMNPFRQCEECHREYTDPRDRRFHSQTNSCATCGPRLACHDANGCLLAGDALAAAIGGLLAGKVVALQGIGGFHLAVDPRRSAGVARLRQQKDRERKPFALMVCDLAEAHAVCLLSDEEERLLTSPEAPIVIAPRRPDAPGWLDGVSDTDTLGIMLPSTPLHLLLFRHPQAGIDYRHLVMTSGNRANEPIITVPQEAEEKLGATAELFLSHDRRIVFRTDDSIVRSSAAPPPLLMRRSRGYVPRLIGLARAVKGTVLALGGDLKNSVALAQGRELHLSAYNGDLDNLETMKQFDAQVRQLLELYNVVPDLVVRDMHPLYHTSRWTTPRGVPVAAVQHHHAHALSVMAEHGLEEALALSFDGTGYGSDGTAWGGEFLHATRGGFTRLGSFSPFPLPGGDEAIRCPPRIAFALLCEDEQGDYPGVTAREQGILRAMIDAGLNCPLTTSLGRIFDAAAAILGLVETASYEGEGPIRLEGKGLRARQAGGIDVSQDEATTLLPFLPSPGGERLFLIDPRPLLRRLLRGRSSHSVPGLSLLFHECVAYASAEGARRMRRATGVSKIALCGGVFQNTLLRDLLIPLLINDGFGVFLNAKAPTGDGGLAVGQAWFLES